MSTDQPVIGDGDEDRATLSAGEEERSERVGNQEEHVKHKDCLDTVWCALHVDRTFPKGSPAPFILVPAHVPGAMFGRAPRAAGAHGCWMIGIPAPAAMTYCRPRWRSACGASSRSILILRLLFSCLYPVSFG